MMMMMMMMNVIILIRYYICTSVPEASILLHIPNAYPSTTRKARGDM